MLRHVLNEGLQALQKTRYCLDKISEQNSRASIHFTVNSSTQEMFADTSDHLVLIVLILGLTAMFTLSMLTNQPVAVKVHGMGMVGELKVGT